MPLIQRFTTNSARPRMLRQNGKSNLNQDNTTKIDPLAKRQGFGGSSRADRLIVPEVSSTFEVFCDSPDKEITDNNVIHQLERKALEDHSTDADGHVEERKSHNGRLVLKERIQPLSRSIDQLSSSTSVYEDACSSVYGSALETQSRRSDSPTRSIGVPEDVTFVEPRVPVVKTQTADNNVLFCHKDYCIDVFKYMRHREQAMRPNARYLTKQVDVNADMRTILIDWLSDVCNEYTLQLETLCLAVSLVDRLLSSRVVPRMKLQLVGTAALMIASKFEEIYPPELKDFTYITDETFSGSDVLKMEFIILKTLKYDVCTPTMYWFGNRLCHLCNVSGRTDVLMCYFIELALLDISYLTHSASLVAAAAVHTARVISDRADLYDETVARYAMVQMEDIVAVSRQLAESFRMAPAAEHTSVYEKYSDAGSRYAVATLPLPKELKP